jgi:hypothetical protein
MDKEDAMDTYICAYTQRNTIQPYREKTPPLATTLMNLEDSMLSGLRQKDKYYMTSLKCGMNKS